MTLRENSAEGGTNGTTLTTGNSGGGSGNAFDQVSITGGTCVYSNAWAAFGSLSHLSTCAATQTAIGIWQGYTATTLSFRQYFRMSSLPTGGDVQLVQFRNSTGNAAYVQVATSGQVKTGNTVNTVANISGCVLSANTDYWIEAYCTVGTSTTGVFKVKVHLASDDSLVGTESSNTAYNCGTTSLTNVRFMKPNSSNALTIATDQYAVNEASAAYLGPFTPPATPPTAAGIGFSNYYSFDARTSTDGEGGALSYTIAQDSGSSFTALEPVDGFFLVERDTTTDRVYTVTVHEAGSVLTDTIQFTAPAQIITVGTNDLVWTGAAWE